jgi:lipopolysaccharide transport system permease protein
MIAYGVRPTPALLLLPGLVVLLAAVAAGAGLWLASLNVEYRDVGNVLPFLMQLGLFVTPIFYSGGLVPEAWWLVYGLNPMVGVTEGFRWALLGTGTVASAVWLAESVLVTALILIGGTVFFQRRAERFADVV